MMAPVYVDTYVDLEYARMAAVAAGRIVRDHGTWFESVGGDGVVATVLCREAATDDAREKRARASGRSRVPHDARIRLVLARQWVEAIRTFWDGLPWSTQRDPRDVDGRDLIDVLAGVLVPALPTAEDVVDGRAPFRVRLP